MPLSAVILAGVVVLVAVRIFALALTHPRSPSMSRITFVASPANPAAPTLGELEQGVDLTPHLAPAGPQLHPGDLYQVQDSTKTWHSATVGTGVLCQANRDVSVRTVSWEYGTDLVDCPERACTDVLGRR